MSWTHESLEAYTALSQGSPVNLLRGSEVLALREQIRRLPTCMDNIEYVRWRNTKIAEILNTREYIT